MIRNYNRLVLVFSSIRDMHRSHFLIGSIGVTKIGSVDTTIRRRKKDLVNISRLSVNTLLTLQVYRWPLKSHSY
jgi:hypothetical protein